MGGKVEKEDFKESINPLFPYIEDQIELLNCLVREVKEEVLYDLTHSQNILSIKKSQRLILRNLFQNVCI